MAALVFASIHLVARRAVSKRLDDQDEIASTASSCHRIEPLAEEGRARPSQLEDQPLIADSWRLAGSALPLTLSLRSAETQAGTTHDGGTRGLQSTGSPGILQDGRISRRRPHGVETSAH